MIPLHDDNPTRLTPLVTLVVIGICMLVFLYQASLPPRSSQAFILSFGAIPAVVFGAASLPPDLATIPPAMSLISSMFLHGGWMHLIGNMLYLWIFGNNIEDVMGHGRFIMFYVLCGIIAALAHAMTDPSSEIPMVGASGAISGILGAYLLLFPRAEVLVLIPIFFFVRLMYVPAGLVLGLWFLFQLISGSASLGRGGGGVAFFAHIGGFVAGMALIGFFKYPHVRFFSPPRHRPFDTYRW